MTNNTITKTPKEQLLKENKITVSVDKYREGLKKFNGRDTYITKSLFNKDGEGGKDNISCGNRMYNYGSNQYSPLDFAENLITEMFDFEDLFKKYKREYGQHVEKIEELNKVVEKDASLNRELEKELEEKKSLIRSLESEIEEMDIIIETHELALVKAKEGRERNEKELKEEIDNQADAIYKYTKKLAEKVVEVKNLKEELREEREKTLKNGRKLTEENTRRKELQYKLYLANKPLPKTPSKFKILKDKTKTKFQHLIEKTKHKSQELIARIEVKVK